MSSISNNALHETLAKLAHLDLSGRVQCDDVVMNAAGGYCDIFVGSAVLASRENFREGTRMKVAIKRLRVHIWKDRDFEKILGFANGLDYLHREDIVHSDLKADNVLINQFGTPLICDFGISRMLSATASVAAITSGGLKGSIRWMAYELLDFESLDGGHHTKESDVWAFGMTVYETLTKNLPYADLKNDALVLRAILEGRLPPVPADFDSWRPNLQTVWKICQKCWILPEKDCITVEQVVIHLAGVGDGWAETCNDTALLSLINLYSTPEPTLELPFQYAPVTYSCRGPVLDRSTPPLPGL
ncbi:kinase-like protein [Fomitiporia mediterranea MF3/22]|uniref:Kinase-like protein n=1 Tax=Fomitiporia mediterranea (strain MF3/22) TaxID=694068 RepID=R7SFD8_FOMME|nr:kinase-like protein [Fomitiporia mediterranea MF3/22]EJC97441.1 kinase-like protein [Fomitiporia mediterranea MF3/22]